jgi:hypothetical protein
VLVGIHQIDRTLTHLGQSPGSLGTPGCIDLALVVCIMEAFEQGVSDDRALIGVEREAVSDQSCGVGCHVFKCTSNGRQSRWASVARVAGLL